MKGKLRLWHLTSGEIIECILRHPLYSASGCCLTRVHANAIFIEPDHRPKRPQSTTLAAFTWTLLFRIEVEEQLKAQDQK